MYELPNDPRLDILGNWEILGKPKNSIEWLLSAHSSPNMKIFSILVKLSRKIEIEFLIESFQV